jgi:phosphoglycerol transferase
MARKALPFILACVAALSICLLIMTEVLRLHRVDLRVPFLYWSDTLCVHTMVKGMIDNGWYWENDCLGAPGRFQMYDYPMADNLHFGVMKLISLVVPDFAVVCNGYYLLTFPLITLSSLAVFRHFRISYGISILGSLLFSFLPYHFQRSQSHLFLSAYYMIPPMVMVILWVYRGEILWRHDEEQDRPKWNLAGWRTWIGVGICLLVSSAGVYYAFFGCYLLGVAGIAASWLRRSLLPLVPAALLVLIISIGTLVNLYPSLAYGHANGPNPGVASRTMGESETWALKISQLFVPLRGHRLGTFASLERRYSEQSSLCSTNDYLGAIGCIGFLVLLARLVTQGSKSADVIRLRAEPDAPARTLAGASGSMPNPAWPYCRTDSSLMDKLAFLTIAALLLATVGGFGSLFSLLVTTSIRCYYRMVIYVAFFCLFAVMLVLDRLCRRHLRSFSALLVGYGIMACLLFAGIWDQTSRCFALDSKSTRREYLQDQAFVNAIETSLPPGVMIFQLPYKSFPESGVGPHQLQDYELFRGYLHSKGLRWSYGAMRNRKTDLWQASVAQTRFHKWWRH